MTWFVRAREFLRRWISSLGGNVDACSPLELAEKFRTRADFLLLDVRRDDELALARIPGCCHIPMHEIEERLAELEPWRGKEIIVMCHGGVRSRKVQGFLKTRGFTKVFNLEGGIDAYAAKVDPSIPRY